MSDQHEWADENLASTIEFMENSGDFDENFMRELTALAVAVDNMGHDEPIEAMLELFRSDIDNIEQAMAVFESARVDEVLAQPDPCEGHRDLADGTCACYGKQE